MLIGSNVRMQFIEMTGDVLMRIVSKGEVTAEELRRLGVTEKSIVRVNLQGDIELRRPERWDAIGGLLGDFKDRVRQETGLDWV